MFRRGRLVMSAVVSIGLALIGGTIHPVSGPVIEDGILLFDRGRIVAVVVNAALRGIAGEDKVLHVVVADQHLLVAIGERVQPGIGVLLLLIEVGDVELLLVGVAVAEQPHAAVDVAEDEAAEVAGERLRPGTN